MHVKGLIYIYIYIYLYMYIYIGFRNRGAKGRAAWQGEHLGLRGDGCHSGKPVEGTRLTSNPLRLFPILGGEGQFLLIAYDPRTNVLPD